jgi:hypothetical protein
MTSPGRRSSLFAATAGRVFNVFCFFTIQSNLLVAVTSILLLIRCDRTTEVFWALWLGAWWPSP